MEEQDLFLKFSMMNKYFQKFIQKLFLMEGRILYKCAESYIIKPIDFAMANYALNIYAGFEIKYTNTELYFDNENDFKF